MSSFGDFLRNQHQANEMGRAPATAPGQIYIPQAIQEGGNATTANDWDSASAISAQLTRAQWADWKTRFSPYEQRLKEIAMGQTDNVEAEKRAGAAVNTAFNTAQGSEARNRSRFGLSALPSMNGRMGLARTATQASAINQTRQATRDRDMALMTGGLNQIREA